jgi:hypothetical protein
MIMSHQTLVKTLQKVCNLSLGGGRVVGDSVGQSVAVYDAPLWSSMHTDALRAKYGNVSVHVEQSRHSASGFVVVVSIMPRHILPAALIGLLAASVACAAAFVYWNMLHVHFAGVENISVFACPSNVDAQNDSSAMT